jgi:homoserine dehydrogenase
MNPIQVGLLGIGTVGSGTFKVLQRNQAEIRRRAGRGIQITMVADLDVERARSVVGPEVTVVGDARQVIANPDIDIVIELIGGYGIARTLVLEAIAAGKHVVTANKALLAVHGTEIFEAASAKGVVVAFEAAVAGGIPIIKALREGLSANRIEWIAGIINGTTNFILSEMRSKGLDFDAALKDAQKLGYAEADPTFDIEGHDTAHKLSILTSLAFGSRIAADDIYMEGISNITQADIRAAAELGYRIKLLGVAQRTDSGIEQRVHPTMVPTASVIAQVHGVTNAVAIETDILGELLLSGPGAGGNATASAVIGDIADIAKSRPGFQHGPVFGRPVSELKPYKRAQMRAHEGGYFIRLTVHDRVGVFAAVAKRMADNNISLESIVQHASDLGDEALKTVILVTHETTEAAVREAVDGITKDGHLADKPQVIRIERAD